MSPSTRTPAVRRAPCVARCGLLAAVASIMLMAAGTGCVPVMWASPQIDHFLATDVAAPTDQVHVFRVEVTQHDSGSGLLTQRGGRGQGTCENHCQMRRIAVLDDGQVPSQTLLSWQKRAGTYRLLDEFVGSREGRDFCVRFYRPGFQLIELAPWEREAHLKWEPALDLVSREKAIDALVAVQPPEGGNGAGSSKVTATLEPGTVDREHRRTLLFAADEYQRLAEQNFSAGPQPEDVRRRILAKAARMRDLADDRDPSDATSDQQASDGAGGSSKSLEPAKQPSGA